MPKATERGVADVVRALRDLGRRAAASQLVGVPYSQRENVVSQLVEAERRGLVRGVRCVMADHRQEAEERLAGIVRAYRATQQLMRPEVEVQMAIAHALLALGDQIAHDWEEDPDA